MTSGGFHVATHELRSHAATVNGVAGDVGTAADAAGTERAGGLVYGVLFDIIARIPLNMWADHIQELIAGNEEVGHAIAGGLRTNATNYEQAEHTNKSGISKSGEAGGGSGGGGGGSTGGERENPLIAETEKTSALQGSSIATDTVNLAKDLVSDNKGWETLVDEGLAALDILSSAENPFGSLIANGVGWLLEHIPGLDDVWRKLMGDAAKIEQISSTWENIGKSLGTSQSTYDTASSEIESWTGPASDSYRKVAQAYSSSLGGADAECQGLAVVVQMVGGLVAACKDTVYTIIANFIEFTVIPAILGAIATSWCTFGGSIPVAITFIEIQADIAAGQVTLKITSTTAKVTLVTERTAKVISTVEKMKAALKALHSEIEEGSKVVEFGMGAAHGGLESQRPRAKEADENGEGSEGGEGGEGSDHGGRTLAETGAR